MQPEIRTFNTTLIACNMCNQPLEALKVGNFACGLGDRSRVVGDLWHVFVKVYQSLLESGRKPTATTCTALISSYAKGGMWDKAFEMYEDMVERNLERSVITYVALMSACEKAGKWETGLKLLENMEREGCEPNTAVYSSVIIMLCQAGKWEKGNEIHEEMKRKSGLHHKPDINTLLALLHSYDR